MDRLEAMSILLAVVDSGTLSAGARRLGLPLTTISRRIADLEAHLRTTLLARGNRRVALTDAGLSYVAACRRILEDVGEAERAVAGEYIAPTGNLFITAPVVFGRLHVLPVITDFLAAYPDVDIRLRLADRLVNLGEEHIDLAVRIGDLPDSSLVAIRLGTITRIVCASPAYLASHGMPEDPRDLATHACIAFEGLGPDHSWAFRFGKIENPVDIRPRLIVNTAEAAVDAAISGLGLTRVLSYQIAASRRAGKLVKVLAPYEPAPWPVSLVYANQGLMPVKLRAFLDFAAPRIKAALAADSD
ncbi:MAG: LysR family transcriptional regulator [Hyphomicrobiales bacterium]